MTGGYSLRYNFRLTVTQIAQESESQCSLELSDKLHKHSLQSMLLHQCWPFLLPGLHQHHPDEKMKTEEPEKL